MTELSIILGSSLIVAFIMAIFAYGRLTQKIEHLSDTLNDLTLKVNNHLKHETTMVQAELFNLKTEVALLNERIANLTKAVKTLQEDRT